VVALAWIEDPDDPRYEISREAFAILRKAGDAREQQLEVVPLRNPPGTRAAYVNFQLCNGAVIVPTSGDRADFR
jgi:agmatine/peptidylarginine deiminase